jgi:KAP family P-loop domain
MAQVQESAYPEGLPLGADVAGAAGESRNREIKGAPVTLGEALELAESESVRHVLQLAGWIAVSRAEDRPVVDGRDLFVAALATGKTDPSESAVTWLFSWVTQNGGGMTLSDDFARWVPTGFDGRDVSAVPLTRRARAVLARALIIARKTAKRDTYDATHVIAGLILADPNRCNDDVLQFARVDCGINLSGFSHALFDVINKSRESGESLHAWDEIRREPPASPLPVLTLAGFTSDSVAVGGGDPLGISPDVRAFARLICLEQAKPPLSVCLFGEWGSGKSTFMERLQFEIAELVKSEKQRSQDNASRRNGSLHFVENIVQIRFNAWHYADANLWASLTAVFFDQLRWGGAVGAQRADYQKLIGKVAQRVRSLEAGADHAERSVAAAKRRLEAADLALDRARKDSAAGNFVVASGALAKRFEELQKDGGRKKQLEEVGKLLNYENMVSDVNTFVHASAQAAKLSGKVKLIFRVLAGGSRATAWAVLGIALLAVAAAGWRYHAVEGLAAAVQEWLGWGGGGAALLTAMLQAFRVAQPILDGASTYAKGAEEERRKLREAVEQRNAEAQQAAAQLKDAESALDNAMKPLREYGGDTTANAPGTILRYFLFEDSDVRDYDKQVGIVSRARRSFEQLNAIAAAARLERQTRQNEQPGDAAAPADAGFQVPDRVVLYIDDLDRCSHEQVYAVLQAIHLLLAFELFVVVVGVDVGWVEGAVAKYFEGDPAADEIREAEAPRSNRRKRAADYLEKIFQIAFWLQPLSTASGNASGGTYKAYVDKLFEDNIAATADEFGKKDGEETKDLIETGNRMDGPAAPVADLLTRPPEAAQPPRRADEDLDDLAAVRLDPEELNLLTSKVIGDLAGKSPRAVKRFVNIYRIVRARLSDLELSEFLGRDGRPPLYPMAALIAAIETGQRMEVADSFYSALKWLPQRTAPLAPLWKETTDGRAEANDQERVGLKKLRDAVAWAPALAPAIEAVDEKCRKSSATVENYLKLAQIVRRYSFNRYH